MPPVTLDMDRLVSKIISSRFNPLNFRRLNRKFGGGTMHVERIWENYPKTLDYVKRRRPKLYVITPPNYRALGSSPYKYKKFEGDLAGYYRKLKEFSRIELHVHLNMDPKFANSSFGEKRKVIVESFNFLKERVGVTPTEIVFGAYVWDNDCEKVARELGLKVIWPHFHTYDWWL